MKANCILGCLVKTLARRSSGYSPSIHYLQDPMQRRVFSFDLLCKREMNKLEQVQQGVSKMVRELQHRKIKEI